MATALQTIAPPAPVKALKRYTGFASIWDERDPSGFPLWVRRFALHIAKIAFPDRLKFAEYYVIALKYAKKARKGHVRTLWALPQFRALWGKWRVLPGYELAAIEAELRMPWVLGAQLKAINIAQNFLGEESVKLTTLATTPLFKMQQQRAEAASPQTHRIEITVKQAAAHNFAPPVIEVEIPTPQASS